MFYSSESHGSLAGVLMYGGKWTQNTGLVITAHC
jgi:hypothetical protein